MEKNEGYNEAEKVDTAGLFENCHSNLDAPLIGRVRTPTCLDCKHLMKKNKLLSPFSCEVLGPLPNKYWRSDTEPCPYKVKKA